MAKYRRRDEDLRALDALRPPVSRPVPVVSSDVAELRLVAAVNKLLEDLPRLRHPSGQQSAQAVDALLADASAAVAALEQLVVPLLGEAVDDLHPPATVLDLTRVGDAARLDRRLAVLARLAADAERDRAERLVEEARLERSSAERERDLAVLARREASREIARSTSDAVTGVYQRGPGIEALGRQFERASRGSEPMVLGFVDVDGLKAVNDSRGHAAGDDLLRAVVNAVRSVTRPGDVIVRFGGDEFVFSLLGVDLATAEQRRTAVGAALASMTGGATASIGLAAAREEDTLDTLISRADRALYTERRIRRSADTPTLTLTLRAASESETLAPGA